MSVEQRKDYLSATTNPRAVVMLIGAIVIPMSLMLWAIFGLGIGLTFYAGAISYYLIYELTHLATHLPKSNWIFKIPYFRKARERHMLHHNTRMMHNWNFNVSFPLFDHLFGTLHEDTHPHKTSQ